jgi:hypothetical protein
MFHEFAATIPIHSNLLSEGLDRGQAHHEKRRAVGLLK